MNKKRILKINLSSKKSLAGTIVVIMLLAVLMPASVLAGNTSKTEYQYISSSNGFATATRDKENNSAAYINHGGAIKVKVEVRSSGTNYTSGTYNVAAGEVRTLANTVYQNGKRNCYLYIKPYSGGAGYVYGTWAPDTR